MSGHLARRNCFSFPSRSFFLLFLVAVFPSFLQARNILVFYAIDADFVELKAALLEQKASILPTGGDGTVFQLQGNRIVAVKMTSGCVNTALSAAQAIGDHRFDLAVSVGPAGSLGGLEVDDWILVDRVEAWQTGTFSGSTRFRKTDSIVTFETYEDSIFEPLKACFPRVKLAGVASGEAFIASSQKRSELKSMTGMDAVDMNLFGLSVVLKKFSIPSIHLRIVSDRADANATNDFKAFVANYNGAGGRGIGEWLVSLPADETNPASYPPLEKLKESAPKQTEQSP